MYKFVPNGPFRKSSQKLDFRVFTKMSEELRECAIGYFGHMWELYAFWAFVPLLIHTYNVHSGQQLSISLYSFICIGIGSIACIISGKLSLKWKSKKMINMGP